MSEDTTSPSKKTAPRGKKAKSRSQASGLIDLTTGCQKWHSPDSVGYISTVVGNHREHWPIRSNAFRRWLQCEYYRKCKAAANAQAIQDAIGVLEGKALFDGREYPVHLRLAEHEGNIYIDLCDTAWRVVEISQTGWRILTDSPVKFRRCKAMKALPEPVVGGTVEEVQQQLDIGKYNWPLVVSWILAALRPTGPFPVLNLNAEQGAGKTTVARKIRALVDPNTAPMRSEPKEPRDLMIAANNSWITAWDNLSRISPWLSDALCRLSTGGGFSTRTLYENNEETIFDAQRPTILTGIEELPIRGDLLDRSIIVTLQNIPENRRRPEGVIWREFNEAAPRMLGVLYDAVAVALRQLPRTTMSSLPRMADFALWATAAEKGIGLQAGEFMDAYNGNRMAGNELALESSPIGKVVMDFMVTTSVWTGTATDLLNELDQVAEDKIKRQRAWPQSSRSLSGILKRLAPNLRAVGVDVEFGTAGRGRNKRRSITIRRVGESCVPNVPNVPTSDKQSCSGDDGVDGVVDGDATGTHDGDVVSPYTATAGTHGDDGDAKIPPRSDWTDPNDLFLEAAAADGEVV